jgi:hypothetical protein
MNGQAVEDELRIPWSSLLDEFVTNNCIKDPADNKK